MTIDPPKITMNYLKGETPVVIGVNPLVDGLDVFELKELKWVHIQKVSTLDFPRYCDSLGLRFNKTRMGHG